MDDSLMLDGQSAAQEPKKRALDEIARDIDTIDEQMRELGSKRAQLIMEHDEAAQGIVPKFF